MERVDHLLGDSLWPYFSIFLYIFIFKFIFINYLYYSDRNEEVRSHKCVRGTLLWQSRASRFKRVYCTCDGPQKHADCASRSHNHTLSYISQAGGELPPPSGNPRKANPGKDGETFDNSPLAGNKGVGKSNDEDKQQDLPGAVKFCGRRW